MDTQLTRRAINEARDEFMKMESPAEYWAGFGLDYSAIVSYVHRLTADRKTQSDAAGILVGMIYGHAMARALADPAFGLAPVIPIDRGGK